ncbi:MAG: recombinase zinc beta ribbon domain-containing protein [Actinomycetota bacterium]|nr:recombinase zinc beta ribbon domain-containing protein [Actinomycetota bacterium]
MGGQDRLQAAAHPVKHRRAGFRDDVLDDPATFWRAGTVRRIVQNDVYRPHSGDELKRWVSPEVAAKLDADGLYGVQWYNRERWERTPGGKKAIRVNPNERKDWIAVPVPNAGVPLENVEAARERIKDNVKPSRAAGRFWELKGLAFCPCGCRLYPRTTGKYRYYVCTRYGRDGAAACEHGKYWPAEALEADVRRFALNLIRNPEVLREDIQAEADRLKDTLCRPERQTKQWAEQLAATDRKRAGYQDQAAAGLMTLDELRARLGELDEQKAQAERELDRLRDTQQQMDYLDDLPGLIEGYLRDLPQMIAAPVHRRDEDGGDALDIYTVTPDTTQPRPEVDQEAMGRKYRGLYDDLGLKAVRTADGLEISWNFGQKVSKNCVSPRCTGPATIS